ncbi:MAG TPA: alpha/beta hydrolase [Dehalococcoidia bacterium]|nr:alpha/beta hydrolase [Dehalococcoidia bacterium]
MTTYVLVHGAWSGAHTWRKVRPLLRAAGHEVFTPSLTGLGERVHLSSPQVRLSTHVQDVVNMLEFEDLRDVVLLGYSYGGMVVTGALEYIADRVAHLVYLDAFVPPDGQSLFSMTGQNPEMHFGQDWLVPPMPRTFDDPAEAEWATPRRTPHPRACFTEPVRLAQPLEQYDFTRTYIKATIPPRAAEGGNESFWVAAEHARNSALWRYAEIETNHMIANNKPEELTELLLELA